jgi:hypothetical protein
MASQKISQLTAITTVASGDYFPVVQAATGENKRVELGVLDVRYTAAASGVAAQSTANTALASGNAALGVAVPALASGNAALSVGAQALSVGTTALASGNAALGALINRTLLDAKGDIIVATANDTPARLAVGTEGQYLTASGSAAGGVAWTTPAISSTFTLLASGVAAASSTINFSLPAGYSAFEVIGTNIKSNGYIPGLRVSTDGGSTYNTAGYQYWNQNQQDATTTFSANASTSNNFIPFSNATQVYSNYGYSFKCFIFPTIGSSNYTFLTDHYGAGYGDSASRVYSRGWGQYYLGTSVVNAIRIQDVNGGGTMTGTIYLYGLKSS